MMIRNEFLGYQVGVTLGLMDYNPLNDMDWTLNALERSALGTTLPSFCIAIWTYLIIFKFVYLKIFFIVQPLR